MSSVEGFVRQLVLLDQVNNIAQWNCVSLKMNDIVSPYFQSEKVVSQGDPLLPTLFNMVAESLTKINLCA